MATANSTLEGHDPLGIEASNNEQLSSIVDDARRRDVVNILKSYTGYYDLFSEATQNALDAIEAKLKTKPSGYTPRIWIEIDIPNSRVRIVDNGIGLSEDEFKFCLRPNVSFKKATEGRGHKGVGATFLAYGYSFLKLESKKSGISLGAILRQGRQWAEDTAGTMPRPKFAAHAFEVPELAMESSGTSVEIRVGVTKGERPKDLGWHGAHTAKQWYDVLRLKTPLGGVYLNTPAFAPEINVKVTSPSGSVSSLTETRGEFYYPHEIPNIKVQSLSDLQKALNSIPGDAETVFAKLAPEFKRLDGLYEVWSKEQLLSEDSLFASAFDEEDRVLIERHKVAVYGAFLRSSKMWNEFNDTELKLNKKTRLIHGGLQLATDYMIQGDLMVIPLTHAIGYQNNSHVIVHFTDGNPDMGRKVFQPELKALAEQIGVRAVNTFKKYLAHLKPDTGAQVMLPGKELDAWRKAQELHRDKHPLSFANKAGSIGIVSEPQQEQDVVALFHQLCGLGLLKTYRIFSTSQSDKYDSLFYVEIPGPEVSFDKKSQPLGVTKSYPTPSYTSEPKVLEYKYDLDSLVSDFDKEVKFAKQIDFVVCWKTGDNFREKFFLKSLLVGDEGSDREFFGATHKAIANGGAHQFEVLILDDLLRYLRDSVSEEARQRSAYKD